MTWLLLALLAAPADAARAKDIAAFHGERDNPLTGPGLVIGLSRTGDSPANEAAIRSLASRLQGLGVSLERTDILSRNIALVMVNADLGPDQRTGSRLDVTVASTGDAVSLAGGYLLMTPLMGADGQVYAVASGPLAVGGFSAESLGTQTRKNQVTVGVVSGGAVVEREVASAPDFAHAATADYVLNRPDYTTCTRLATAINTEFGATIAQAATSSTVVLTIPDAYKGKFPEFAAKVEAVGVDVDGRARVVISERTGTVVMGADVTISAVAIAYGGLQIDVQRTSQATQPAPFSLGTTATTRNANVTAQEASGKLTLVEGVDIGHLVTALNAMGCKPRDLVVILQAIKEAGALNADVVAM